MSHLESFHSQNRKLVRRQIGVYRPLQSFKTRPYTTVKYAVAHALVKYEMARWVKNLKAICLKKLRLELRGISGKPNEDFILSLLGDDPKHKKQLQAIIEAWKPKDRREKERKSSNIRRVKKHVID